MNEICRKLTGDHRELELLLGRLQRAAKTCDREELQATWNELEGRLVRHMEAEEYFLLPLVEASHPAEVKRTLFEHASLRDRLAELGLAVELHAVRETDIQTLIDQLASHAQREEKTLYDVAGEKASMAVVHSLSAALKAVARSVLRSDASHARAEP